MKMRRAAQSILSIIILTLILLIPSKASAAGTEDYVIKKYNVSIIVNENNTFDITETITADFRVAKHGIYRTIPLQNKVERLDGTTSHNRAQITNVRVNVPYKASTENGYYKLTIGSKDQTLTGEKTYVIQYTYNLGKDPLKGSDELYFNIIGSEWDTTIEKVTFTITMPKEFDREKLGFSAGPAGSQNSRDITYSVLANQITGEYAGSLQAGEALTVRCELPEGYFVNAGPAFNFFQYFFFLVPIIGVILSFVLWSRYGRNKKMETAPCHYPPEGLNSLEVGFYYKGKAEGRDVTSLLIYLANQGYLKISAPQEGITSRKATDFYIDKLRQYDGDNPCEQTFLRAFSIAGAPCKIEELKNKFYITTQNILSTINSKENREKILEKDYTRKKIFIVLAIICSFLAITFPPIHTYAQDNAMIFALLFPGAGYTVLLSLVGKGLRNIYYAGHVTKQALSNILFGIIWGLGFGGSVGFTLVLSALRQDSIFLIGYLIGLVCIAVMLFFFYLPPRRTPYGNEMWNKINNYRQFLKTAQKQQLDDLNLQNPSYAYNNLPYAYVLGVTDSWLRNCESIMTQGPDWFDSPNGFDRDSFEPFMKNGMDHADSVISTSPSGSSGDSGSSGGGSSDGGSGGGGGGSW